MKVAVIQLSYGDDESVAERTARVVDLVRAQRGHDLVVLPELWSAGGFDYRAWPHREQRVDGEVTAALAEVAQDIGCVLHTGSLAERPGDEQGPEGRGLWNTSVVLGPDGQVCAVYRKIHRFGFGEGEPRLMEAGTDVAVLDLPAPAHGLTMGLSTCYDLRFPSSTGPSSTGGHRPSSSPPPGPPHGWSTGGCCCALERSRTSAS